jgi:hypothetical protein
MTAHVLIMYPTPKNPAEFDRAYREQHLPYAGPISDVSFPTLDAMKACATSEGGKQALARVASISSGGAPLVIALKDDA